MSNKRRIIIITISVLAGTLLSVLMFKLRRGGTLTSNDMSMLLTNLFFSLAIILGVGFLFIWNKKKDL